MVGSDGSSTAGNAVLQAAELARALNASLTIVRAYREGAPGDPATAYDPTVRESADTAGLPADVPRPVGPRAEALASLEAEVAAAREAGAQQVACEARAGDPAEAICAVAE